MSGVEDLIIPGKTGLLIDSDAPPAALAKALGELMGNDLRRAALGRAARKHVTRWAPGAVLDRWEALLWEAANQQQ